MIVHLDNPDPEEKARRISEVSKGGPVKDDCPLCKALAKSPPAVVVYDRDAVLCFGQNKGGAYATGFPRKPAQVVKAKG
jgi:hypothetical protein